MEKVAALRAQRGKKFDELKKLIDGVDGDLDAEQSKAFDALKAEVKSLDAQIERALEVQKLAALDATPVADAVQKKVAARPKEKDFPVGRLVKSLVAAGGNRLLAAQWAEKAYGEGDPIVKALNTSEFANGGATVPEDFANEVIELLRPATVVRASGVHVIDMPRGTMRMPKQTAGVTGTYGSEGKPIRKEQPKVGDIVANFKKLSVKVPISNDWLRYTSPGTDRLVQNDIVQGLARTEDLAFLRGDGTADWPKGLRNIAIPATNVFSSNAAFTLDTIDAELTQMINALETQDVAMISPVWTMNPRSKNFLMSLKNDNGFYVYKDEMTEAKTLRGYPFKSSNQHPNNLGAGDESEIMFFDANEAIIFDSMMLSLMTSQEAAYQDESGNWQSCFDRDETIIRAIAEHDFHLRHDQAVAVLKGVKWK